MREHERLGSMIGANGDTPPIPAATVVLVRPADGAPELLMVKRDSRLAFAGGVWVFPGGRVDPGDYLPDEQHDSSGLAAAELRAAAREAFEESGLCIDPAVLIRWSHWTAPPQAHKRFTTAFFVAPAPAGDVTIDDGEIRDHQWVTAADALDAHRRQDIELAPPTFITLTCMQDATSAADLLERAERGPVEHFATRFVEVDGRPAALYHGDVGYHEDGDPAADGPHHRLWLDADGWSYVRT